jgi:putative transposase
VTKRVAYARQLVAEGHSPSALARILQISRQAIYRIPTRPPVVSRSRPPADEVEAAIVEIAEQNPTDGYRIVTAWVRRRLGRAVNRKRVLRVMRERRLIQRRTHEPHRRRPGFFKVERPGQLWHLDMTSIWVAEHGWVYLNAIIDCCTREIVGWDLTIRCRAVEAITVIETAVREQGIRPGTLTLDRQRLRVHRPRDPTRALRSRGRAPPWRVPRPREPGVHRELVPLPQGTLRLAP